MINDGATINNNGKIGQCYYFNASSYLKESTYDWTNFNTTEFSLCCWYKEPSPVASGNSQIICIGTNSGWNNIRIGLLRRTSNGYPMFSVSDGSNAVQYNCTATTFSLDTWNHIACIYNNGEIKIYLNGILNKTYTTTIRPALNSSQHLGIGAASNGAEKLTGYLNDIRIYDHCLSDKEIEEISKGLVLHYKLDDPNFNLLHTIPKSFSQSAYNAYQFNMTENLVANQTYTMQLWDVDVYHSAKTAAQTGVWVYWGGGSVSLFNWAGPTYFTQTSDTNYHADYLVKTFTVTSSNASGNGASNAWLNIYNSVPSANGTRNMHIGAWKLEKSSIATPWRDSNDILIYDSSGNKNNGTIVGSLITNDNSAKYNNCIYSDTGTSNNIVTPQLYFNKETITLNIWFKSTNTAPTGDYHMIIDSNANRQWYEVAIYKGGYFRGGLFVNGARQAANCTTTTGLNGNWHMLTLTYDKVAVKRYFDGILESTSSVAYSSGLSSPTALTLFRDGPNANYACKETYLSDFRIYATALTENQIKELYNTSATIDNNGNIYAREVME